MLLSVFSFLNKGQEEAADLPRVAGFKEELHFVNQHGMKKGNKKISSLRIEPNSSMPRDYRQRKRRAEIESKKLEYESKNQIKGIVWLCRNFPKALSERNLAFGEDEKN